MEFSDYIYVEFMFVFNCVFMKFMYCLFVEEWINGLTYLPEEK